VGHVTLLRIRKEADNDREDYNGVTMATFLIKNTQNTQSMAFSARARVCLCVCVCARARVYTYTHIHGRAGGKGQFKHNGESIEIAFCCVSSSFIIDSSPSTQSTMMYTSQ
jgi:hypothetical protein